ncbi:hypothetical protein SAY87_025692 [Trapa incisa]|uniref:Uncharacterized protein n=1 Tax=Trapa incisa TaxID=236973 RepID=A0AAN7GRJ8_9MYRT|nr:hypothetical protein SAY87_025692 [Trapa incisa]
MPCTSLSVRLRRWSSPRFCKHSKRSLLLVATQGSLIKGCSTLIEQRLSSALSGRKNHELAMKAEAMEVRTGYESRGNGGEDNGGEEPIISGMGLALCMDYLMIYLWNNNKENFIASKYHKQGSFVHPQCH